MKTQCLIFFKSFYFPHYGVFAESISVTVMHALERRCSLLCPIHHPQTTHPQHPLGHSLLPRAHQHFAGNRMQSKQLHLSEKINIPWTCKPGRMGEKPARLLATCIFCGAAGRNSSPSAIHHLGWLLIVRMCVCGRGTGKLQGAPYPLVGPCGALEMPSAWQLPPPCAAAPRRGGPLLLLVAHLLRF